MGDATGMSALTPLSTPRGWCELRGAFGDVVGVLGEPLAHVRGDALTPVSVLGVLDVVDGARSDLADDERIVFVLGYEACCALDPRTRHKMPDPALGPAAIAWRLRVTPLSSTAPTASPPTSISAAPSLTLRTTAAARDRHRARIRDCREALLDGVIYQANLAHRLTIDAGDVDAGHAFFVAHAGPTACAAFVDMPGFGSLISLSPERFVTADLDAHQAFTYPIKGTVKRSGDDDDEVARLRASDKDRAEHVMIVDLLRNDLGRVAVPGGVSVQSLMHVVSTSSVHHLESTIAARLRDDVGVAQLLVAVAPGGSITGAPKSAAVDVIAALEDGPRGAYTGVLGVVDGHGHLVTSLLIRTWIRPDQGSGSLHVGGGIVVDSDPDAEWLETLHKAAAFGQVVIDDDA